MLAKENKKVRIFVNGEEKETYFISYNNEMINLGKRKLGEKIKLEICLEAGEFAVEDMYICYENEEALLKHYNNLKEKQINLKEINSRKFAGEIALEEKKLVMFTIPYEEGWKIEVDGKDTEYIKVLDTFIGLSLEKGKHQITLKYTPPKMNLGIILSIFGIIMLLSSIIISKKYKK